MYNNNNTGKEESQDKRLKILRKCAIKKAQNKKIIKWLKSEKQYHTAEKISNCANYIGITEQGDGIAKVVKADFCRERICAVCAWRRQSKFVAQMSPILIDMQRTGYKFIFLTLTVRNVEITELKETIDNMLHGYKLLMDRRKIKRAFAGCIRSLELKYTENDKLHPHIHMLIAVNDEYFVNPDLYITQKEFRQMWQESVKIDYDPYCYIETVKETERAKIEVLKYALKPTIEPTALSAFYYIMKGRRTISFTGIFAKMRREYKLSDFDKVLTDDIPENRNKINYTLYKLDCTGGVYKYIIEKEIEI